MKCPRNVARTFYGAAMTNIKENPADLILCADGKTRPRWASRSHLCWNYVDQEWGRPPQNLSAVFELLTLVVFQVGITWHAVLSKRKGLRAAFAGFDTRKVAEFSEADIERLVQDSNIFRNRRKISATIASARALIALEDQGISFSTMLSHYLHGDAELIKDLKSRGFSHIGPTSIGIVKQSMGVPHQVVT